jgi:hypothetical protein
MSSTVTDIIDSLIATCLLICIVFLIIGCSLLFNDEGTDVFRASNCVCPCYECCPCCDDYEWKDETDCSQGHPYGLHSVTDDMKEEGSTK